VRRAEARAAEFNIPQACTVEDLLADPEIKIVVNLTTPQAHTPVNLAAIEAGKHVHCEKPLALSRAEGQQVLAAAAAKGLRVGCAPDTFLGGGIQTCRKLIDDGWIGEPIAATAFMTCHGHESWHPDPAFYYMVGGGPMLDMGPYYLTALVNLVGPDPPGDGHDARDLPRATYHQPTEVRHTGQGRSADARRRADGVRERCSWHGHHDVRRLGREFAAYRNPRHAGFAERA
jgi:predicted dehydrogenase